MVATSEAGLLATGVIGIIAVIVMITTPLKVHPFLALVIGSLGIGLVAGEKPAALIDSVTGGAGGTLGSTGLILVLGTVLGTVLAESGATRRLAEVLTRGRTLRGIPWMVSLLAFIVALPLFFEVALAVLLPLLFGIARQVETTMLDGEGRDPKGRKTSPYLLVGVPALGTVASVHALVPPHPGPTAAASALHTDIGAVVGFGVPIAVITMVVAGQVFAGPMARRMFPVPPRRLVEQFTLSRDERTPPPLTWAIVPVVLPLALVVTQSVVTVTHRSGAWASVVVFAGQPVVALLIAVLVAMVGLGWARGTGGGRLNSQVAEGIAAIAPILLIIGGGGALSKVMVDCGIGKAIAHATHTLGISPLVLAWLVAVLIRLAVGSATVAIITASGIVAPAVATTPGVHPALVVLALGCGSIIFPHINNAASWQVKESFGMSLGEMFASFTVIESTVSVLGFGCVLAASALIR
ncbi:GntT/GntP/DsdX family permease [Streptantibioticus cattleyicolor]|uniref:Putative gluconate transporter n=1 Tax=Streptantibioticus cattleyicolor (strain ATCC 35852 / DSM 46488 / JCM 4925 / NBRC 14057 / NRRL 8057) TaxID=1003195 RepID=F8JLI6_STREN|nr:gluconate:H+ symporter [Streptantibioticus cattleyicolor]AEW98299.1 putative gluconate transporter [Streptantibioticus cattleyicolor NRRL 8057 = DSM 46488]CCB72642.1 putative Gluconate permease [Streptantibioticus cattleyicolor NRRL 8057 = DSM 46488]